MRSTKYDPYVPDVYRHAETNALRVGIDIECARVWHGFTDDDVRRAEPLRKW